MSKLVIPGCALIALASSAVGAWPQAVQAGLQLEEDGLAIYGTVLQTGTTAPVSGAQVVLRRLGGGVLAFLNLQVTTAAVDGRFAFEGLSPGEYQLGLRYPFHSETSYQAEKEIDLSGTGLPVDVDLWMVPMSTLSGRVMDSSGAPVEGVCVSAQRRAWFEGGFMLYGPMISSMSETCLTDDAGQYSVTVPSGEYYLGVRILTRNAVESAWTRYYPGVATTGEAIPVTVGGGVNLSGFDIRIDEGDLYRVRFDLNLPEYAPGVPEPLASYLVEGDQLVEAWVRSSAPNSIDQRPVRMMLEPTGEINSWTTPPLPPGEYQLVLMYTAAFAGALSDAMEWEVSDPGLSRLKVISEASVVVEDEDVDLGTLPEVAKTDVDGRITFRNASGTPPYSGDLPDEMFSFRDTSVVAGGRAVSMGADGTFTVYGMHPGRFAFELLLSAVPDGWYVASVRSGGQEILRDGLEVGGGPVSPVEVIFSNDAAQVEGLARMANGTLVPDARVILIPPLDSRGPFQRFPAVRADQTGAFRLERIPPGDYRVLVLDTYGDPDPLPFWESPDFLRQYELRGERITVDPGARLTINSEAILVVD